jgi:MFS family permease
LLLGAFGIGAVIGAFAMSSLRERFTYESIVKTTSMTLGVAMLGVAFSPWTLLTVAALVLGGSSWMISITIYNIGVQTVLPRWVSGRALAAYQTAIAGGMAVGAWIWGHVAQAFGVSTGLSMAGIGCMLSAGAAIWLRLPNAPDPAEEAAVMLAEPQVDLDLTPRSGPIVVEIIYNVPRFRARAFYSIMQEVQMIRQRNGGYDWSLARDIGNPELWTERFHCPTWLDYLRQRSRSTQAERQMFDRANAFHEGEAPPLIRRMLDRPFGSVRWREDVRENAVAAAAPGPATP